MCDESPDAFEDRLQTLRRVAIFHNFEWLKEVVDGILRISPADEAAEDLEAAALTEAQ